jgi:hypothetical protein
VSEIAQFCCPTCGVALNDRLGWSLDRRTFIVDDIAIRFTRREALIFDALWRARDRGGIQNIWQFLQIAYADEIDGGPDAPQVHHLS